MPRSRLALERLNGFQSSGVRLWRPRERRCAEASRRFGLMATRAIVAGSPRTYMGLDGWTVRTVDRAPAAQFEHTVMATRHGPIVLSQ